MNGGTDGELPEGWASAVLAEVVEPVPNTKPEDEPNRLFHYVDISSIDNGSFRLTEPKPIRGRDAPSRARRPIRPGDVVFSNVRTYLRNIALIPSCSIADVCSTGFTVLRSGPAIESRYLFRYTLTNEFIERVTPEQTGTHYPATSDRVVLEQPLPLPPLAEQRRIVAAVETVLARVNATRDRLSRVPAILKRFRQSVLSAACSGRLTAAWRKEAVRDPAELEVRWPELPEPVGRRRAGRLWGSGEVPELTDDEREGIPENWLWVKVGGLGNGVDEAVQVGPMSMQSRDFEQTGVPVLNVGCIQWGWFDKSKLDFMPKGKAEAFDRYHIRAGDILFTRSGTIGRCALATAHEDGYLMTFHLLRVRSSPSKVLNRYLCYVFQGASHIRRQMVEAAIGSTRAGFNTNLLAGLDVPIPPLPEQKEIVRRVDALFALADRIEAKLTAARKRVDSLTQAVLAKAFRGELVPTEAELARREKRTYESAADLLARIRTEREQAAPPAKPARRTAGKR